MRRIRIICLLTVLVMAILACVPAAALDASTLHNGSKGEAVRKLQQALITLGFLSGKADGVFGNNQLGYIRQFIMQRFRLVAVIDIPLETFMPNTGTKTSILIVQKMRKEDIPTDYPVFMCVAETCGHDRRGNIKEEDDIAQISTLFRSWAKENNFSFKKYGK